MKTYLRIFAGIKKKPWNNGDAALFFQDAFPLKREMWEAEVFERLSKLICIIAISMLEICGGMFAIGG